MFHRILVPFDGSPTSSKALGLALQLARDSGGRVRLVHAFDELAYLTGYQYNAEFVRQSRAEADKVLQAACDTARASGVAIETRLLEAPGRRLGEVIGEEATRFEADLIVVGTHGRRGIGRVLLGSGAEEVLRMAPVPVLSVRGDEAAGPR